MPQASYCDITRLPLGRTGFSDIRKRGKIYVDKTALLAQIARFDNPLFLSRPRRFGKSLLIDTLHNLFAKGLDDFQGLEIAGLWKDKTYKVVHIDFSSIADLTPSNFKSEFCDIILHRFNMKGIISALNEKNEYREPSTILSEIAERIENSSVVLLIDEYDAPLTHHMDKPDEMHSIMSILNNFYAVVKQYTSIFRFIFITGVTRTAHVSIFSAFNNLRDVSFENEYNTLLGFTQDEIQYYFDKFIDNAADSLNKTKNTIYKWLQQSYDGFQFAIDTDKTVYNPWSVLSFLQNPKNGFQNYWYQSGGISSLIVNYLKIRDNFDFLNYDDRRIVTDKKKLTARYELTAVPADVLLCQTGYFTARTDNDGTLRLVPPNNEVEASLLDLYLTANNLEPQLALRTHLNTLVDKIDEHDVPGVVGVFNAILRYVVSPKSKVFLNEWAVRDTLFGSLQQVLHLQLFKEMESLEGYCDMELVTPKTHMVIEFKRTYPRGEKGKKPRNAEHALADAVAQIESHHYGETPFSVQTLFRVAMVISTEKKQILSEYCKTV